jgi:tetratricopeptide (TPR) repeat protein
MFLTLDDIDLSMQCLLRAIEADCANADAYYYLGFVNATNEQFEDAVEFFSHAIDIKPDHIPALRDSAVVYLAMGRTTDAAARIKKALALNDNDLQLKAIDRHIRFVQKIKQIANLFCRVIPGLGNKMGKTHKTRRRTPARRRKINRIFTH